MSSSRPVLVRPLLLGLILLHASAYVLRKNSWDNDLNDALRILHNEGEDVISEPVNWRENPGYYFKDYDEEGDPASANLEAAENRLLLENFLDAESAALGGSPTEVEDLPDDVRDSPLENDFENVPLSPGSTDLEVPVDNSELENILEPSKVTAEQEAKREYDPTSLVKKSPEEVKIMATLTPSEVKTLLEEAEEKEEEALTEAVEKIEKEEEEKGEPHGIVTEVEENIHVQPVSKDELEGVFAEDSPKVKVEGSLKVDAKPITGGVAREGADENGKTWRPFPSSESLNKEAVLEYIASVESPFSITTNKKKRSESNLNDPEVARQYIKTFLELEDNENSNLANALNLATLAQVERTDRYVKREAKFIRKAIQDEKQIQLLRQQLRGLQDDSPSTEDSVKAEGPQLLKRAASLEDEGGDELQWDAEAADEEHMDALRAMLREKLERFLQESAQGNDAAQWMNQPVDIQPHQLGLQDMEEMYLNPFWREVISRYNSQNEVEKRGQEFDIPEEIDNEIEDEDVITEESPEGEVSEVLEAYVDSLSPAQKADLQEQVAQQLSEAEEELCPALDLTDSCAFVDEVGLKLDEEARDLCNRHQMCYICGSAHGMSALQCDTGYMEEADRLCDVEADPLSCKQDALDFFSIMSQAHTSLGPSDIPGVCYSSCTLDYINGLTKK